uniref:Uncharacterized protein n=1 Tax=Arundo donax TaxID=35708 RepID=A0A0A9GJ21_ARUDO
MDGPPNFCWTNSTAEEGLSFSSYNATRTFVRVSSTPLDSRYFLNASFFASLSILRGERVGESLGAGGRRGNGAAGEVSVGSASCRGVPPVAWHCTAANLSRGGGGRGDQCFA